MEVLGSIARELHFCREQRRRVAHVRVVGSALAGAVIAVPLTPERMRVVCPDALSTGEWPWEILIHPDDWLDLLRDHDPAREQVDPSRVLGLDVVQG